jgi:hypothetical protein
MPIIQLGPKVWLLPSAGTKVSVPPNGLLTHLQLETGRPQPSWLRSAYRSIQGERLELGEEHWRAATTAPGDDGGSAPIHAPEGSVVSALELDAESLSIWCCKYLSPANFKLGPEEEGIGTKEPRSSGKGNIATKDGCTMTGFQLLKDPYGTLAIKIQYRQVL